MARGALEAAPTPEQAAREIMGTERHQPEERILVQWGDVILLTVFDDHGSIQEVAPEEALLVRSALAAATRQFNDAQDDLLMERIAADLAAQHDVDPEVLRRLAARALEVARFALEGREPAAPPA